MNWPRRKHNLVRMGTCKWADKYCGRSHDVYPRGRVPMADTTQCHNAGNNNNGVWFKWKCGGSNNTDGVCKNTSKKPCNDHRHHMQGENRSMKWPRNRLVHMGTCTTTDKCWRGAQWCIYKGSSTRDGHNTMPQCWKQQQRSVVQMKAWTIKQHNVWTPTMVPGPSMSTR